MSEPLPAYQASVSSISDIDSMLFSPQVTESVGAFTPVSERSELFEDIQRPTRRSVEDASSMSRTLPSGMEHPKYYMQESMVVFQIDNTLYRLPGHAFVQHSQYFKSLLQKPSRFSSTEHAFERTEPVYLDDEDVTSIDFECLLSIIFPSEIGEYAAATLQEWTSILHLAVKWGFSSIRRIAAQKVFLLASAVDRIVLGRRYGFDSWLLDAFVEVCERADLLPLSEASRMSFEDYFRISQARETIRLSKAPTDLASIRTMVTGLFGLQDSDSPVEDVLADPREVQPPTPTMGGPDLSPLTEIDTLAIGDELVINVSDPVRRIQVRYQCPVDGHSTQITYVPTTKDIDWVRCAHGGTKHPHRTKKVEITMPEVAISDIVCADTGQVRAGFYSTTEVRPWTTPTTETTKRITLEPPLAAGAQPKIAIGLSSLVTDASSNNIRVRATVAQDPCTAHEAFTTTLSTWGTTLLYAAAVNWLEVPFERGFQTGSAALGLSTGDSSPMLRKATDRPVELANVRFERSYERPPTVVCWLTGLDMGKARNCRIRTFASHIDGGGFTLSAATWHDSEMYGAGATWIAIPQDAPGVFVGKYSAHMDRRSGHVAFPRAFRDAPKVIVGLSILDFSHGRNLRLKAFARDVTPHGFIWEVHTWSDSHMHQAEITVIAIESCD